jgi:NADH dehydrogenase
MPADRQRSIVILGAGFGGIAAAKALAGACEKGACKVTVIDRNDYHVYAPLLYEAATGFIEHENVGSARLMRAGVTADCAAMLARWNVDFLNAEVTGIGWDPRRVLVKNGDPVAFDDLIIAFGAETNFYGIPGMEENAIVLKTVRDADRVRQRIHDALHKQERDEDKHMDVVIGGAGATGVEFAAELTMFLRRHMLKGHLRPDEFTVSLVEAQPRILGALDPALSAFAAARLKKLGVKIYLDTAVKEVRPGKAVLVPRACKPGESPDQLLCDFRKQGSKEIETDLVLWTGGIRGSSSLELLGIPLDERGKRIEVGPSLEVPGFPGVFAIGDAALLMDPSSKRPVPWLAQSAMAMGKVAAGIIAGRLRGDAEVPYRFHEYPVIVPLGGKFALAKVGPFTFRGLSAWLLKEAANLRYFLSILPPVRAVKLWWRGTVIYSKND